MQHTSLIDKQQFKNLLNNLMKMKKSLEGIRYVMLEKDLTL